MGNGKEQAVQCTIEFLSGTTQIKPTLFLLVTTFCFLEKLNMHCFSLSEKVVSTVDNMTLIKDLNNEIVEQCLAVCACEFKCL